MARLSAYFLSKQMAHNAMLLPELNKLEIHIAIPDFKRQSLKR